jgi:hypothetical protein
MQAEYAQANVCTITLIEPTPHPHLQQNAYTVAMRGLFSTAIIFAIIFFSVGHFHDPSWNVGVLPQTPLFLYRTTSSRSTVRRLTGTAPGLQFDIGGQLRRGSARLEVTFERPDSIQNTRQRAIPEEIVYEAEFFAGQPIAIAEYLDLGTGFYRFRIFFNDVTGRVSLDLPTSYEASQ